MDDANLRHSNGVQLNEPGNFCMFGKKTGRAFHSFYLDIRK